MATSCWTWYVIKNVLIKYACTYINYCHTVIHTAREKSWPSQYVCVTLLHIIRHRSCNIGLWPRNPPTCIIIIIVLNRSRKKIQLLQRYYNWFIAPGQAHRVLCPIIILLNRLHGSFRLINSNTCSFIVGRYTALDHFLAYSNSKQKITMNRNVFKNEFFLYNAIQSTWIGTAVGIFLYRKYNSIHIRIIFLYTFIIIWTKSIIIFNIIWTI